jgi:hypothetical protein
VNSKKMIIVGTAALMLLVGAGVAYASSSGGGSSGQATGTNLDKAKSVALEQVNGRVTETEVGDEEGAYQIEVTRDGGSKVDVNLDKDFNVISTPSDNEGQGGQDASNDGGG